MGGIVSSIFGGGSSKSQQTSQSSSGFGALPPAIQEVISQMATSGGNVLNPGGQPNAAINTLPQLAQPSQTALGQIQNQNFAITPESIRSNINEQMNPYNQSVINEIERAQNGQESQLSQYLTQAGQFGSNRGMLGASDISQAAADQIGTFLSNQYNQNLQNALTTIPSELAQSAQGAVQGGLLQQGQTLQNQQAPITSLLQLANLIGTGVPATSQSTGQGTSSAQQNNGILAPFKLFG